MPPQGGSAGRGWSRLRADRGAGKGGVAGETAGGTAVGSIPSASPPSGVDTQIGRGRASVGDPDGQRPSGANGDGACGGSDIRSRPLRGADGVSTGSRREDRCSSRLLSGETERAFGGRGCDLSDYFNTIPHGALLRSL